MATMSIPVTVVTFSEPRTEPIIPCSWGAEKAPHACVRRKMVESCGKWTSMLLRQFLDRFEDHQVALHPRHFGGEAHIFRRETLLNQIADPIFVCEGFKSIVALPS